jgi:hypothetical protein
MSHMGGGKPPLGTINEDEEKKSRIKKQGAQVLETMAEEAVKEKAPAATETEKASVEEKKVYPKVNMMKGMLASRSSANAKPMTPLAQKLNSLKQPDKYGINNSTLAPAPAPKVTTDPNKKNDTQTTEPNKNDTHRPRSNGSI